MRKLATVREISAIKPIEGADRIESAIIDGWQVVTRKGEFQPGDLGVYFEIDSFLPIEPEWSFLSESVRKDQLGNEGIRLRTRKFRGAISQGLLLPVEVIEKKLKLDSTSAGMDLTEALNIRVWQAPIPACLSGQVKGGRPNFVPKTDQERIQNLPEWFDLYKDVPMEVTEKLDGTSMSIYYYKGTYGVTSRNRDLTLDQTGNSYVDLAKQSNIFDALKEIKRDIVIQGELCGPGIQKNTLGLKIPRMFIYNIHDIKKGRDLSHLERIDLMMDLVDFDNVANHIGHVPILGPGEEIDPQFTLADMSIEKLLQLAQCDSAIVTATTAAEGLVFKSLEPVDGDIISFKVINNDQLLKSDTDN